MEATTTEDYNAWVFELAIAARCKALRLDAGYTLTAAADKLNSSRRHIGRIERHDTVPTLPLLRKMSRLYGVPMLFFFTGDGLGRVLTDPLQVFRAGGARVKFSAHVPRGGRAVPTKASQ